MACSPKYYDGKGGVMAYTHWIEKMESVQDMSGCGVNQKVKYTAGLFIGKSQTWWNTQVRTSGQEAEVGMTWVDFKVLMRKELCLNNEMQKMETEFWCHAMVEVGHDTYIYQFHKLARLVPHFVTPKNKKIERNGSLMKNIKKIGNGGEPSKDGNDGDLVNAKYPTTTRGACFECFGTCHYKAACPTLNRAPRQGGNRQNQAMAIEGGQGRGNNGNQVHGGTFMMGAEEALFAPNIMTVRLPTLPVSSLVLPPPLPVRPPILPPRGAGYG
nr:reverse transcriptase domain-containing protein [Tanacetum cinerariifolium]